MQNHFMCFSLFFSPHSTKIHTLPWHMHSCSTLCFTSVLTVPCCVSLSIPRLSVIPTFDSSLLLTLSVVSFTLPAAPRRCCDAGRHYFYMQQIPRVCAALLFSQKTIRLGTYCPCKCFTADVKKLFQNCLWGSTGWFNFILLALMLLLYEMNENYFRSFPCFPKV